jgi:hypothetical protein
MVAVGYITFIIDNRIFMFYNSENSYLSCLGYHLINNIINIIKNDKLEYITKQFMNIQYDEKVKYMNNKHQDEDNIIEELLHIIINKNNSYNYHETYFNEYFDGYDFGELFYKIRNEVIERNCEDFGDLIDYKYENEEKYIYIINFDNKTLSIQSDYFRVRNVELKIENLEAIKKLY